MFERYRGLIRPGTAWRWVVVVLLALAVSALEAVGAVLIYALVGLATDPGSPIELPLLGDLRQLFPHQGPEELIVGAATAVAVFFVVRGATVVLQAYLQGRVANAAAVDLSTRLLDQYLRLPYAFHLRRNSAQLIRNAHESVTEILGSVLMPAVRLLAEVTIVLGLAAVLVVTAPVATALAAATLGPLVFLVMRSVQPRIGRLGAVSQRENGRSIQLLQQGLHGYRDITVLGRQRNFVSAYRRSRRIIARTRYLRMTLNQVPRAVIEAVTVALVGMFIVVSTLAGDGGSLAVVGLFAYAALRIMPALNKIMAHINDIRFGRAALDDVQADLHLAAPPEHHELAALPFEREVRLEGVAFVYEGDREPALADIDVVIPRGHSLGVVGATGAGKSTFVDLVIGLSRPTSGRITIDGVDLSGNEAAWHRNLGLVSQDVFLLDDTLRRNIALGLPDDEIDEARLEQAVRLAQLGAFVATLPDGLDTWVGERGVRVSGGQRQRIAIARALYPEPSVLVFDEGTSALDNMTEAALIESLAELRQDHTLITVAHRLSTVEDHDTILLLEHGRIEAMGSFEQLLEESPAFRRLARPTSAP